MMLVSKKMMKVAVIVLSLCLSCAFLSSCENDLNIQQDFPFDVNVMPVPGEINEGQTVEIRLSIERNGNYQDTQYFIRYFQYEGQGMLQYYNNPPYSPNDTYPLAAEQFRLYYTSQSEVTESFDVWISDSFGNEKKLSFNFNNNSN